MVIWGAHSLLPCWTADFRVFRKIMSHPLPPPPTDAGQTVYCFCLMFFCPIIFPRVPEIVYQPSMLGIEQAGIAETIDFILNHFSADLQTALVQVRVE